MAVSGKISDLSGNVQCLKALCKGKAPVLSPDLVLRWRWVSDPRHMETSELADLL